MERTKQPQNTKRRRQWVGRTARKPDNKRGGGERRTREDKVNFFRNASGRGYLPGPKGERMRKLHAKRRAAAKRAKQARKINR